jgi:hypothetical protein
VVRTLSPFCTALVLIPATSEPAPGSVTPYDYAHRQKAVHRFLHGCNHYACVCV